MTLFRRLSYLTLGLAFLQIVFGAIVRITGSGLGCGDHWPKCNGEWFPPHDRMDLIIEITHRYLAAALSLAVIALLIIAFRHRRELGMGGRGGVLRPILGAFVLVGTAAIFGAVTVKTDLNAYIVATHLTIAMTLLGVLTLATVRAGGFSVDTVTVSGDRSVAARTYRSARVAAVLTFCVIVMGALTANIHQANGACKGFPHCRDILVDGGPLYIHLGHRILAFLLFFHLLGMVMASRKRIQAPILQRGIKHTFGLVFLQLLVAAALIEMHLPPPWRSLHQAIGTGIWLSVILLAILSRYAMLGGRRAVTDPKRELAIKSAHAIRAESFSA